MTKVSCADMGNDECNESCEGATKDKAWENMLVHSKEKHAEHMANMTDEQMKGARAKFDEVFDRKAAAE